MTKFTNAAMNVCRHTEQLPVSVRKELIQRKCMPMLMYGLSAGFICYQYKKSIKNCVQKHFSLHF